MARYVAEIDLNAPIFMPVDERMTLSNPEYYGCLKGYWKIHLESDHLGTSQPIGFRLTVELEALDRERAENAALSAGRQFAQVAAAYSGSPLETPRLNRLGQVGASDGLLEQFNYYYLDGAAALPRAFLRSYKMEKLLMWFGDLDEKTAYRLELAARWYGMSLSAQDPVDGYLSGWIGLESVGPALSRKVHVSGTKARCDVCQNQPGIARNTGSAGIEHAIQETAPELLTCHSVKELRDIRNDIAHGLKPSENIRLEGERWLPDLQLALIFAILTAARPDTSDLRSGSALLPRDYKPYPDARISVRSPEEVPFHKPFFGE